MRVAEQDDSLIRQTIWDLVDWIESDLSREMNSMIIAERSGYSRWYLQRLFKLVTGKTLARYIRVRRLTVAAGLLKATNFSVTDIYVQVGFDDSATFCRIFQRHFGLPPTLYRASNDDFSSKMILSLR